ncbi:MAG: septal ring lytic transglycosylase RlpA family protein [Candidatus Binataceae bacterium]
MAFSACSTYRAAPIPPPHVYPGYQTEGTASWYGPGFNGHRTASGAIYNQEDLTAASTIFPLGSRVMVTNLDNGRSVEVAINDRGPYVKDRKIDLSHRAAAILAMIGPGTAPVRMVLLAAPGYSRQIGTPARYFVQLGSFAEPGNAYRLRTRMAVYYPDVSVDPIEAGGRRYYRVRMGAFATQAGARARAEDSARFGLPMILVSE